MEYPALEKFMDRMGITYSIKTGTIILSDSPRNPSIIPIPRICVEISVQYKGESQYEQIHCYTLNEFGELQYREDISLSMNLHQGNRSVSISDGVLSYMGDNKKVDEYFDQLARKKALERLRELKY